MATQFTDSELISRTLKGDRAAFRTLCERHRRRVVSIAYSALGNAVLLYWIAIPGNYRDATSPSSAPIDNFAPCSDYTNPTNVPARGHANLGVYAFVDGHAKALRWAQIRGNDFYLYKRQKPEKVYSP